MGARSLRAAMLLALAACRSSSAPPTASEAVFFPDPPDPPRIQFLRGLSVAADVEPPARALDELLFGARAPGAALQSPYGAAFHAGKLYLCDLAGGALFVLDFAERRFAPLHLGGRAKLAQPCNLAFAEDGTLYVADLGRRQVVVLDAELRYRTEFGPLGTTSRPVDVDVRGEELFVTDAGDRCVHVLERTSGKERRVFGRAGLPVGGLRGPTNLALAPDGSAYVVDTIDCRVFVFDPQGDFQRTLGEPGNAIGAFARPKGIACLDDTVFVIDAAFENCQVFDRAGTPLLFFGGPGPAPGAFTLPAGIWAGAEGLEHFRADLAPDFEPSALLVVTNFYGEPRVGFYALGKSRSFIYPEP